MSTGIQRNDTQQYCTLDETSGKSLNNGSYIQYSPPSASSDWWSSAKSDVVSMKDDWSSDSDSSQQTFYSNANTENIPISEGSFNVNNSLEDVGKKRKKSKDGSTVTKPAQVVERRNARERRRVQAVNGAFQKLRKVVPIEENKSKRMSKVKTLQLAIDYINQLQSQLQFTNQHTNEDLLVDFFSDFQHQQQQQLQHPVKLEPAEFQFTTSYYPHLLRDNEN